MEYNEVIQYMNKRWKSDMKLGLSRVKALLAELSHPEKQLRFIHVAGTNGKGSTVTAIASILAAADYKVGVYTSPYLERFTDRIRILNGKSSLALRLQDSSAGEIAQDTVAALFTEILAACDRIVARGGEEASEFEVLTSAAILYFYRETCDVVVLETGLGGRLDATNAIDFAEVTVITALSYDHCQILGNSMGEIAMEKAAIIKKGTKAVCIYDPYAASLNPDDAEVILQVVGQKAADCGAPLIVVRKDDIRELHVDPSGQSFLLTGFEAPFHLPLQGAHQQLNAALAIQAIKQFEPKLARHAVIDSGLRAMCWPGRMEMMSQDPLIILDGAHNPQAAKALCESVKHLYPHKRFVLLFAVLGDKDYAEMLEYLRLGLADQIIGIVCTAAGTKRDLPLSDLAELFKKTWTSEKELAIIERISQKEALSEALKMAKDANAGLLVCGSLYLVSSIRALLKETELLKMEVHEQTI